ncbi:MAG: hypothetical protein ABIR06_02785 [Cyclobacteriaceae bacterium]
MKFYLRILILASVGIILSCQQKSAETNHGHEHDVEIQNSDNQILYEEVMKIHDEVMPKLDDLYKSKVALQTHLKGNPGMPDNEKKELNARISRLDSASEGMMVWMRHFNPVPDSEGEEKARGYLENEMVRVKKVKENILSALQEAEIKR